MNGAVLVAVAATIGNLLQGWDNATIAGNFFMIMDLFCIPCYFNSNYCCGSVFFLYPIALFRFHFCNIML